MADTTTESKIKRILVGTLQLLIECLNQMDGFLGDSELDIVLDILQHDYPKLWEDLWDIRTPFLDSEDICAADAISGYVGLHGTLHTLALTLDDVLRTYR